MCIFAKNATYYYLKIVNLAQIDGRAAILGKIQHHEHAVDDLNIAIRCGYPKSLRFKAYQRLAQAYFAIGSMEESVETYKKLFQSLDEADLPVEKIRKMKSDCIQAVKQIQSNKLTATNKSQKPFIDLSQCALSDKIKIESTKKRGRFSVASVSISAGEVVMSDTACLLSVSPGLRDDHCYTCGRDAVAPLPSHVSSGTCFCSLECRTRGLAWDVGQSKITHFIRHQLDRPGNQEIPAILAALEFTIKNDFYTQLERFKNWRNEGPTKEITPSQEKILAMVKHFETMDLTKHFAASVLILLLLKYLEYIPKEVSLREEKQILLVICHHFAAIKSNIHTVCELRNGPESHLQMKPVGVAMFPNVALHINHSCNPNTFVIDVRDRQVTVASRDIAEGEEITQIYLGHFGDTEREKRQRLLMERYHFQCLCEACDRNFPLAQECLEQCKTFAETPNELLKKPLIPYVLTELDARNEDLKNQVEKALVVDSIDKAVEITIKRIQLIGEHLREPHILYLMARMSLTNYMWCLHGNTSKSFKRPQLPVYF